MLTVFILPFLWLDWSLVGKERPGLLPDGGLGGEFFQVLGDLYKELDETCRKGYEVVYLLKTERRVHYRQE